MGSSAIGLASSGYGRGKGSGGGMKPGVIKGSSRSLSQESSSGECGFRSVECGVEQESVAGTEGGGLTTGFTDSTDESEDPSMGETGGAPGTTEHENDDEGEDEGELAGSLQMVPEPCG
jgi:hypothetical protein